jgi:hypothetical protein
MLRASNTQTCCPASHQVGGNRGHQHHCEAHKHAHQHLHAAEEQALRGERIAGGTAG